MKKLILSLLLLALTASAVAQQSGTYYQAYVGKVLAYGDTVFVYKGGANAGFLMIDTANNDTIFISPTGITAGPSTGATHSLDTVKWVHLTGRGDTTRAWADDDTLWGKRCDTCTAEVLLPAASGGGETDTLDGGWLWNGTSGFEMVQDSLGTRKAVRGLIEGTNVTIAASGDSGYTIASTGGGLDSAEIMTVVRDTLGSATGMNAGDILNIDSASGTVAEFGRVRADSIGQIGTYGYAEFIVPIQMNLTDTSGTDSVIHVSWPDTVNNLLGNNWVPSWDSVNHVVTWEAQAGASGSADTGIVVVSGTEYTTVNNRWKFSAGSGVAFTRTDVGPGTYDSIEVSVSGSGTSDSLYLVDSAGTPSAQDIINNKLVWVPGMGIGAYFGADTFYVQLDTSDAAFYTPIEDRIDDSLANYVHLDSLGPFIDTLTSDTIPFADSAVAAWKADTATLAEDLYFLAYNNTGATIAQHVPVHISNWNVGALLPEIDSADASGSGTAAIGLTYTSVAHQDSVIIIEAGRITGVVTSSWSVNDRLYVAPGGGLTNTRPTGTDSVQELGEVLRSHPTAGIIELFGAGDFRKHPNLEAAKFWVGAAADSTPAPVAMSGDATMTAAGVVTVTRSDSTEAITDGGVDLADLAANSVDSTKIVNGSVSSSDMQAMTSDSLARILSDETGSGGGFVRASSPTITSPTISTSIALPAGAVDATAEIASNIIDSTHITDGDLAVDDVNWHDEYIYLTEVHGWGRATGDSVWLHAQFHDGAATYLLRDSVGTDSPGDDTVMVSGFVPYACTIDSFSVFYKVSSGSEIDSLELYGPALITFTNLTDSAYANSGTDLTSTTFAVAHYDVNISALAGYRYALKYWLSLDADNDRLVIGWVRLKVQR